MSIITLIEKQGTMLPPRARLTWREECVVDAFPAGMTLVQGGFGVADMTVADHLYSTRTGSSFCSPPV